MDKKSKYTSPTLVTRMNERKLGYCERIPGLRIKCPYKYECYRCEYADRVQIHNPYRKDHLPCIDGSSVLRESRSKGVCYYKKVVAVKREYLMSHFGREEYLYMQLFMCTDGPGCLPANPIGEVDGYFLSDPNTEVTLLRYQIEGIPTLEICRKVDRTYFTNLLKDCGYF